MLVAIFGEMTEMLKDRESQVYTYFFFFHSVVLIYCGRTESIDFSTGSQYSFCFLVYVKARLVGMDVKP